MAFASGGLFHRMLAVSFHLKYNYTGDKWLIVIWGHGKQISFRNRSSINLTLYSYASAKLTKIVTSIWIGVVGPNLRRRRISIGAWTCSHAREHCTSAIASPEPEPEPEPRSRLINSQFPRLARGSLCISIFLSLPASKLNKLRINSSY